MHAKLLIEKIKGAFTDKIEPINGRIPAAIMIIIHFKDSRPYIILTKRSKGLKNHASQISFPGGTKDDNEEFIDTAIREVREELGLEVKKSQIIGMLKKVDTFTSNFSIIPFLAVVDDVNININKDEIEEVIDADLLELLKSRRIYYRDDVKGVHYKYEYNNHIIWGATARILDALYHTLEE